MLFNSHTFLFLFLPVTLVGFALLKRRGEPRAAIAWLTAASFVFYGWWNPVYVALLALTVVVNYTFGRVISDARRNGQATKPLLWLGIVFNLGLLGYYKYLGFFAGIADALAGSGFGIVEVALPLAISFFTFQQIAYLVDAERGLATEPDFLRYCLFVTFFPQLIAGPIVHHGEMMGQFAVAARRPTRSADLAVGLTLLAVGLFKKVVVADHLALYASPVFADADAGGAVGFARAWSGTLAYSLQIYFDFSGYSDMAVGLARLFGIRLPVNFFSPYRAGNVVEFWRRWHMTLSRFLRDYLYVPLGGNRRGRVRRYGNLLATMVLGGLWHGAGWTFVAWGALHGAYLVANHLWRAAFPGLGRHSVIYGLAARALTLLAVAMAWTFFRAETFAGAWTMIEGMAGVAGTVAEPAIGDRAWRWIAGAGLIALFAPNIYEMMARYRPALGLPKDAGIALPTPIRRALAWRPTPAWAAAAGAVALTALLSLTQVSEFLYFRF